MRYDDRLARLSVPAAHVPNQDRNGGDFHTAGGTARVGADEHERLVEHLRCRGQLVEVDGVETGRSG